MSMQRSPHVVCLSCTMLLLEELGKCTFVGKGSTCEYLLYIVMINLVKLSSC